jgi:hypothetical protein
VKYEVGEQRYILVPMTLDEFYERKRLAKAERSRRLANLPVAKKMEIAEKFRDILNDALREGDERRAAGPQLGADKNQLVGGLD